MHRLTIATVCSFSLLAVFVLAHCASASGAGTSTGERIYQDQCAHCHGAKGEGVAKEYGKPLAGDRPLGELEKQIAKLMPADDPGSCVGDDAHQVASYIYDAFYSPLAQERNRPARIELARLTVRQYQQTLADLVGSFRWTPRLTDERGLKAEYFKSRNFRKEDRAIERVDPIVKFDYGESSPDPEKIKPETFAGKWTGGLIAPETGDYEFIVTSDNAARLWVNDTQTPLVDGSVKSGTAKEHRETIHLLGGRVYPIRLEFHKSKEAKEKRASIALEWKLPGRSVEPVPTHCLSPINCPSVFVVSTRFPPDDRSQGFERGTSVSEAWEEATSDAAWETAEFVLNHLQELSGARPDGPERLDRLKEFCVRWVSRALRHPLSDDEKKFYVERSFEGGRTPEVAVRRVVLVSLMSPRFLFPDLSSKSSDGYAVATRLALELWDSLPDEQLSKAAAGGKLKTADDVRRQAERMVNDPRTRSKLSDFFVQWLKVDRFVDLAKDSKRFPEFDMQVISDLRTGLDLFLNDVVWSDSSDFRQLLLSDSLYLNGRLSKYYGGNLPADAPFTKVSLGSETRAGVLTNPYLMAGFAYTASSSPIHRGVFVARNVLGRALRAPPIAVAPFPADLHAGLTTRERVALQTKDQVCQSCHRMINSLGFAFENFDAVGRFRKDEKGKPIDAQGAYQTRTGETVQFKNVGELARFLAKSDETNEAFVEQLFEYLTKQSMLAYSVSTRSALEKKFVQQNSNIRKLMVDCVVTSLVPTSATTELAKAPDPQPPSKNKPAGKQDGASKKNPPKKDSPAKADPNKKPAPTKQATTAVPAHGARGA